MDEEKDLIVLGRKIGTYAGWDALDEARYVFYGFKPADGYRGPIGDEICVIYDDGIIEYSEYDSDGIQDVNISEDIIIAVIGCERAQKNVD